MSTIKLSEEELEKLKKADGENRNITFSLGQVKVQQAILEGQNAQLLEELAKLQKDSNEVAKELQDKYGIGNIDLATGIFTKDETQKVDSK
tara:strand:+ start:120 stop:392 length:273 start_codon:yes stop_codon:yes gene_type:complete